ncbi:MAG TPA: TRAP transporter large permease [Microvirga sp.]|jgi:tripartite ATP-independent transporter DctM subunit|nr:TRAP transporter large permease [Microvirga sp.]
MIIGTLAIAGALLLMMLGMPVGYALAVVGLSGFAAIVGIKPALTVFGQVAYDTVSNPTLVVLPLFLLMGNLVGASGMAKELYRAAYAFMGHLRGGLAMATIVACGAFSAICGSSVATAATMAKVALPAMRRYRYDDGFAAATVASGGTLGILIPPSTAMIIYGLLTETSIGKLFVAGIIPGLIGVAGYIAAAAWVTWRNPSLGPGGERSHWRERLRSLRDVWAVLSLFTFVIAGIYAGAFTATEAAGMGAFGALVITVWRRSMSLGAFIDVLTTTARTTAMLFFLLIGAIAFTNFLEVAQFSRELGAFIQALQAPGWTVIAAILLIYIILGCFLEELSMTFLTIPIFFPVVTGLGYDPIWFGVLFVVVMEIALISPPVGMNIFVIQSMAPHLSAKALYRGLVPFLVVDTIRLLLLAAFPSLSLILLQFVD